MQGRRGKEERIDIDITTLPRASVRNESRFMKMNE